MAKIIKFPTPKHAKPKRNRLKYFKEPVTDHWFDQLAYMKTMLEECKNYSEANPYRDAKNTFIL